MTPTGGPVTTGTSKSCFFIAIYLILFPGSSIKTSTSRPYFGIGYL